MQCNTTEDTKYQDSVLAAGIMFHGYLNSLHYPDDDQCQAQALCEARTRTDQLDSVARVLGYLAHNHAHQLLELDDVDTGHCGHHDQCVLHTSWSPDMRRSRGDPSDT